MNTEAFKEELQAVKMSFPDAFINLNCELIIIPKFNIFFNLGNVTDVRQIKLKVMAWVTGHCCSRPDNGDQQKMRRQLNEYLKADFSTEEMYDIYLGLHSIRKGEFRARHYLFAFGGYDFKYLDN